ncbi:unnamed protein product [Pleuronectes platessa]|uniref:Uncharacterized protein n=1 Tax=Pleuronectes platessa TaxID=8262 RepID=A0A9N7UCR2_PLEPL|nr:unnamed protein product [Pleuronectes platessa]
MSQSCATRFCLAGVREAQSRGGALLARRARGSDAAALIVSPSCVRACVRSPVVRSYVSPVPRAAQCAGWSPLVMVLLREELRCGPAGCELELGQDGLCCSVSARLCPPPLPLLPFTIKAQNCCSSRAGAGAS